MSEDRPLTDFADASEESADGEQATADSEAQAAADNEQATAVDSAVDDADPAIATYRWQPDGAVCEACGEPTERQWRDDDGFVCPDCKSW